MLYGTVNWSVALCRPVCSSPAMVMTLPIDPGSKVSLTAWETLSLASSLPASISSVSSRAMISLV